MTRPTFDELGLATARLWATRSADPKVQVGACLLDRWNRVVGVGYNGRAAGEPNERESLEQMRDQNVTYENVDEDRGLADGDFASAAFKSTNPEGGDPIEMNDVLVEIGGPQTIQAFSENLRGVKAGAVGA